MEKMYTERISCSKSDKQRMDTMRNIFYNAHPDMKGIYLSEGFIINKLMDYYEGE